MIESLTLLGTTILVVAIVVIVHYEFLYFLTTWNPSVRVRVHSRFRFVIRVVGSLIAHTVEVTIFAVAYWVLLDIPTWGSLKGNFDGSLEDCIYFSFVTFTTVGYGDILPEGAIRHLVGFEALTGLLLVTWTASFLYVSMQQFWRETS